MLTQPWITSSNTQKITVIKDFLILQIGFSLVLKTLNIAFIFIL